MFIEFGIKDFIDIFLVALMLFYIYRLMKESSSLNVFIGILMFVVLWLFVSQVIEMRLLGSIMDKLVSVLNHYFIGSGRIRWSAASSAVGLVTLLVVGSILIPTYGVFGSAMTNSIAFTAMLLFSWIVFKTYKS